MELKTFKKNGLYGVKDKDSDKILMDARVADVNNILISGKIFAEMYDVEFYYAKEDGSLITFPESISYAYNEDNYFIVGTANSKYHLLLKTMNDDCKIISKISKKIQHGHIPLQKDDYRIIYFGNPNDELVIYDLINEKEIFVDKSKTYDGVGDFTNLCYYNVRSEIERDSNFLNGEWKKYFIVKKEYKTNIVYDGKLLFNKEIRYISTKDNTEFIKNNKFFVVFSTEDDQSALYDLYDGPKAFIPMGDYYIEENHGLFYTKSNKDLFGYLYDVNGKVFDEEYRFNLNHTFMILTDRQSKSKLMQKEAPYKIVFESDEEIQDYDSFYFKRQQDNYFIKFKNYAKIYDKNFKLITDEKLTKEKYSNNSTTQYTFFKQQTKEPVFLNISNEVAEIENSFRGIYSIDYLNKICKASNLTFDQLKSMITCISFRNETKKDIDGLFNTIRKNQLVLQDMDKVKELAGLFTANLSKVNIQRGVGLDWKMIFAKSTKEKIKELATKENIEFLPQLEIWKD